MERLQRAMESRSRLEAENRKKLEMDQKRKEEERARREQEANERRLAKEHAEAKEREEKKRRHEKLQRARKEQEEAQRAAKEEQARMRRLLEEQDRAKREGASAACDSSARAARAAAGSAEEKKRRLQDFIAHNRANAALAGVAGAAMAPPHAKPAATPTSASTRVTPTSASARAAPAEFSYQMSPYRENSDSEEEDGESRKPRKPIPSWARTDALVPVLKQQAKVDPDEIFPNPSKTCSLDAVFTGHAGGSGKSRRSSSGNWFHDRLTWKEELTYKREMGFVINK